jgi:hypothetical protein
MAFSADDIVSKFPVKTLPTINREPDCDTISTMAQALCGNAASLSTPSGGGAHGHIRIIMTAASWATLATATLHITPLDFGPLPIIPATVTTAAACEQVCIKHKEARRICDNHINMDDALKGQVIDTIEDIRHCEVRNKHTSHLSVTTRDLLDHLIDRDQTRRR